MAYDEGLAQRIRECLSHRQVAGFEEKKMFGGLCMMVSGHMCCGILEDKLMARIGPEQYESSLKDDHAFKMDFTGREMKGFVYVHPEGLKSDADLDTWVDRCLNFVNSLPPK